MNDYDEDEEVSWDTEEVERWMLNDEYLYSVSRWHRQADVMRALFEDVMPQMEYLDVDLDNVDWEHVVATRQGEI